MRYTRASRIRRGACLTPHPLVVASALRIGEAPSWLVPYSILGRWGYLFDTRALRIRGGPCLSPHLLAVASALLAKRFWLQANYRLESPSPSSSQRPSFPRGTFQDCILVISVRSGFRKWERDPGQQGVIGLLGSCLKINSNSGTVAPFKRFWDVGLSISSHQKRVLCTLHVSKANEHIADMGMQMKKGIFSKYRCLWKNTPPEKNTIRKIGFQSTKSGAG